MSIGDHAGDARRNSRFSLGYCCTQYTLGFFIVWLALLISCPLLFYRNPTSKFFDPVRAYEFIYTTIRTQESVAYIESAAQAPQPHVLANGTPDLCIGVATFPRPDRQHLANAIGSLLSGLSETERSRLHVAILFAHTEPSKIPDYDKPWVENAVDTVLTYAEVPDKLEWLKALEQSEKGLKAKSLYDYTYLMEFCEKTGAQHVAVFEDDTVALDGWFHRTLEAVEIADKQTQDRGHETYLYLRLFFTEKKFGWNSEEFSIYALKALEFTGFVLAATFFAGSLYSHDLSKGARRAVFVAIFCHLVIFIPLTVTLVAVAGRNSIFPLQNGVIEMPKYGCCSQGMVFQRQRVPGLVEHLRSLNDIPIDSALEVYADTHNELRWALVPSVIQHVGRVSTKPSQLYTGVNNFNFGFEKNDPGRLREEHLRVLGQWPSPAQNSL